MDTSYEGQRVCGVAERVGGSICRWDKTGWDGRRWQGEPKPCRIEWSNKSLPADMLPAIRWAWDRWAAVCAIEPVEVSDRPMIYFESGQIDGPSSTLAWANLPCGADPVWPRHLRTLYDSAEAWSLNPNQPPQNGIHLGAVACHEIGHLLGLDHDARRGSTSLLAPTYTARILTPQEWDIEQAQLRYGPPLSTPAPTDPPADLDQPIKLVLGGKLYEGRVALVQ